MRLNLHTQLCNACLSLPNACPSLPTACLPGTIHKHGMCGMQRSVDFRHAYARRRFAGGVGQRYPADLLHHYPVSLDRLPQEPGRHRQAVWVYAKPDRLGAVGRGYDHASAQQQPCAHGEAHHQTRGSAIKTNRVFWGFLFHSFRSLLSAAVALTLGMYATTQQREQLFLGVGAVDLVYTLHLHLLEFWVVLSLF